MGAAASIHDEATQKRSGYKSFEEAVREALGTAGSVVDSRGEVVGVLVEANQGAAQDDAGHGSFDYIWRLEDLSSRREDDGCCSQFKAKGLEWEVSVLLPASTSRDQTSVSVRLYLRDAPCDREDGAKVRLTYAITLFNQNSCRQDWQRSAINAFADHHDGKWGFKDFIASDAFMDPSNGFVVDGSCTLGVTLLRVHLLRAKKESLLVHHKIVNHDHTWIVRNFSTMKHQCMRRQEFEAAGCRWSIYLHRIRFEHCFNDDVLLFLSLDSTTGQKKSIAASYQFHVKGLAGGYEFCDAYTNVFVPGQCHGGKLSMPPDVYRKSGWSFDEDTCTVRVRLTLIGYTEAKGNDARALTH